MLCEIFRATASGNTAYHDLAFTSRVGKRAQTGEKVDELPVYCSLPFGPLRDLRGRWFHQRAVQERQEG